MDDPARVQAAFIAALANRFGKGGAYSLAWEEEALDGAAYRAVGDFEWRVGQMPRCLVTTRRLALSPDFAAACQASASRGWPVHLRSSGGTTVAHRPGILAVTWVGPVPEAAGMDALYERLCQPMTGALADVGVLAHLGAAPGAYCDGAHNILGTTGRRLAGTAARLGRRPGPGGESVRVGLVHAALTLWGDVVADVAAVQMFEQALGLQRVYDAAAMTSVSAERGGL